MKKTVSLFLLLLLVLNIISISFISSYATSSSGSCGDNVKYSFDSSTGVLTLTGKGDTYAYENIAFMGFSPFNKSTDIKTVLVKEGIMGIGTGLFNKCSEIKSVSLPSSLLTISRSAFSGCSSLTSVTIPSKVTEIKELAFNDCSRLVSAVLPKSLKTVGMSAFAGCSEFKYVFYTSSSMDWKNISIAIPNNVLNSAAIHYNAANHTYKNSLVKATLEKNGSFVNKCSVCNLVASKSTIYYPKSITLSPSSVYYSGKVRTPKVLVRNSQGNVINSKYYTVKYSSGRKKIGRYPVKITFKGDYSGSITKSFDIKPNPSSVTSIRSPQKKAFAITWKKVSGISGYQIQNSTNSTFNTNVKTNTAAASSKSARFRSGIKGGTKYYVRIRTYKTVKYNGKAINLYSGWSKVRSVKTKG